MQAVAPMVDPPWVNERRSARDRVLDVGNEDSPSGEQFVPRRIIRFVGLGASRSQGCQQKIIVDLFRCGASRSTGGQGGRRLHMANQVSCHGVNEKSNAKSNAPSILMGTKRIAFHLGLVGPDGQHSHIALSCCVRFHGCS